MPSIQELIHTLELGAGARYLRLVALLLGVMTIAVIYDLREFQNFRSEEAMDNAQLARNISEGRGFTTRCVRPFSMGLIMKHRVDRDPLIKGEHPDLVNPPLYPALVAAYMKIPGLFKHEVVQPKEGQFQRHQPDFLIGLLNQALFFLTIALTWRLASRLFEPRVATVACLAMLGCDLLWQFSASGQTTMLALALLTLLANVVYEIDKRTHAEPPGAPLAPLILALVAGLLCALLLLTRYSLGILVLPVALFLLASTPGKLRAVLPVAVAGVFLVAIAPWLVRNWQICGNPFGTAPYSLVQETSQFTDNWLERSTETSISRIKADDLVRKFFVGLSDIVRAELPQLGGTWLTAFFLAGLLVPFVQRERSRFRWFTLACLLALVLTQPLIRTHLSTDIPRVNSENLLVLLAPLVFVFGGALVVLLVFSLDLPSPPEAWRTLVLGGVIAVLWLPLLVTFGPPRTYPIAYPPYYPPSIQRISHWFEPGEVIMSDMPWAVAWYGDRQSMLLTSSPDQEFVEISDWLKPVSGLFITRLTIDQKFLSGWVLNARKWGRFIIEILTKGDVPKGFPLRAAPSFLTTFPDHILLADKDRWGTTAPTRPPASLESKPSETAPTPSTPPPAGGLTPPAGTQSPPQ